MATFRDLLSAAKAEITEVDTADRRRAHRTPARSCSTSASPTSTSRARIPGAVHIPRGHLEAQVESQLPDKDAPVVVYCAGGVRSAFAAKTLQELGYTDVVSMAGGFGKWKDEGRAVDDAGRRSPPSSATATSATSSCPRSARPAS